MNDDKLFEAARERFDALSQQQSPFLFSLLTVGTHHPEGFPSRTCAHLEPSKDTMRKGLRCTDILVDEFVRHIEKSSAGANTLVVLLSDHLAMRNTLSEVLERATERTLTFLMRSPWLKPAVRQTLGTHFDIGPTILDAAGWSGFGDFPLGQSLLSHEKGFFYQQGFTSETLAEFDIASLAVRSHVRQQLFVLDAERRVLKFGETSIPLTSEGGPLPEGWTFLLNLDLNGGAILNFAAVPQTPERESLADAVLEISFTPPSSFTFRTNKGQVALPGSRQIHLFEVLRRLK